MYEIKAPYLANTPTAKPDSLGLLPNPVASYQKCLKVVVSVVSLTGASTIGVVWGVVLFFKSLPSLFQHLPYLAEYSHTHIV